MPDLCVICMIGKKCHTHESLEAGTRPWFNNRKNI